MPQLAALEGPGFLSALLTPLVLVLALVAIGLLLRRKSPIASLISLCAGFILLFGLSTPYVAGLLLDSLQWYPALSESDTTEPQADAIVVLSAGRRRNSPEYAGDTVGPLSLERIRYAARLKRQTKLPLLISGGELRYDVGAVAHLLDDALREDFAVEVDWLEERSHDTAENALFSAQLLKSQGITRVYLVTHAWHMPRAKAAFERHDITVIPAPTGFVSRGEGLILGDWIPQADALSGTSYAFHEWLGLAWYWIRFDLLDEKAEPG